MMLDNKVLDNKVLDNKVSSSKEHRETQSSKNANPSVQDLITVNVAYAPTIDKQYYLTLQVNCDASIWSVLQQTGWLKQDAALFAWCEKHKYDEKIDKKNWRIGIFSQKKRLMDTVKAFDRIEVYRVLTADPMWQRKAKASDSPRQ